MMTPSSSDRPISVRERAPARTLNPALVLFGLKIHSRVSNPNHRHWLCSAHQPFREMWRGSLLRFVERSKKWIPNLANGCVPTVGIPIRDGLQAISVPDAASRTGNAFIAATPSPHPRLRRAVPSVALRKVSKTSPATYLSAEAPEGMPLIRVCRFNSLEWKYSAQERGQRRPWNGKSERPSRRCRIRS